MDRPQVRTPDGFVLRRTGGYNVYEIASSAEGATFTPKPGAAPQGYENQKNISAESAIHSRHTSWIGTY